MKNEMNENEMTVSEIMSKALFLARYEPERIEEYAKVFYPGAWRIEEYQKVFYPGAWRQIGRELARYNPSFLGKYAKNFLQDDWHFIGEVLLCHNPEYIEKLKQYMPVEIYNKYK